MSMRGRIAWKVGGGVIAIVALLVVVAGYGSSLLSDHYSLASARSALRFNSDSIRKGIRKLMMTRNNVAVQELIGDMSRENPGYGDIRLLAHPSGLVVASRSGRRGWVRSLKDRSCAPCHRLKDPARAGSRVLDEVVSPPGGGRRLAVVAPIANEPGCRTAACHVHAAAGSILGVLQFDYSLRGVDALIASSQTFMVLVGVAALVLGVATLGFLFRRLLEQPVASLIAGTRRIGGGDLGFRFEAARKDEIGQLEESFNAMTARVQAQQAELRDAKEYLEGIIEGSSDIIITTDADGRIQTFNRGAEQILGYPRSEVAGRALSVLFADPAERDRVMERLGLSGEARPLETRLRASNGEVRDVLLTLTPLRDPTGTAIGAIGIGKDIGQETRLRNRMAYLEKFAAIGQALTGIQHAVKNMLGPLKCGAFLIQQGLTGDRRQAIEEGQELVEKGITRISDLSLNMLNYAKEWKPEFADVDLPGLLAALHAEMRPVASDRGVAFRAQLGERLPSCRCDPRMVHMAVLDLVSNAIDACLEKQYGEGESSEIILSLSLREAERVCAIEVRDNGCGMSEETRWKIFTPLFSTKREKGTGMGLALTSKVIGLHGGTIQVESELDRGSTFRILLPVGGPGERASALAPPGGA
jgi:PAS domain S-box-containing protein